MDETYKIQSGYEKLIIIYTSDTRVPLYKTRVVRKQLINCTGIVIVIFDLRCWSRFFAILTYQLLFKVLILSYMKTALRKW